MVRYHHKQIKKFNLNGVIHDESAIGRLKNEYIRLFPTKKLSFDYLYVQLTELEDQKLKCESGELFGLSCQQ